MSATESGILAQAYADALKASQLTFPSPAPGVPVGSIVRALANPDVTKYIAADGSIVTRASWSALSSVFAAGTIPRMCDTWTKVTRPNSGTSQHCGIAFGAGVFVMQVSQGDLYSSTDGITWTQRNTGQLTGNVGFVCFDGSQFIAGCYDGGVGPRNVISTSPDGITWTARNTDGSSVVTNPGSNVGGVARLSNTIVIPWYEYNSTTGGACMRSTNGGTSWAAQAVPWTGTQFQQFTYGNSLMVAADNGVYTSTDGASWTSRSVSISIPCGLIWTGTSFLVAANSGTTTTGTMYRSTDGITWYAIDQWGTRMSYQSQFFKIGSAIYIFAIYMTRAVLLVSVDDGCTFWPIPNNIGVFSGGLGVTDLPSHSAIAVNASGTAIGLNNGADNEAYKSVVEWNDASQMRMPFVPPPDMYSRHFVRAA